MSRPSLRRGPATLAGLVVAAVFGLSGCGGSSHHAATTQHTTPPPPPKPHPVAVDLPWPFYGYNQARTRFFPNSRHLDPPFRRGWTFHDKALLEFTPVIYDNAMYFEDYYGHAKAISTITGRPIWQRGLGTLAAASPGLDIQHNLVFFVLLSLNPGARLPGNGRVVALSMKTGKAVWSHGVGPGSESSPVVVGQSVIFGDQGGTVYSYRTTDGHLNWTFHASGSVKGGVAYAGGRIYFGDYGGHVHALNAANGHEIWSAGGGDTFYSTAAAAFGHVYIGNTNGDMYAFSAGSGGSAWTGSTGAYVYASPAVANVPGLGPTVYEGSYDGVFRAYNALTGSIRWSHPAGGRVNGSATIIGDVVYFADLGENRSVGLDVRTGRQVFSFPDGDFTPVLSDGKAVFLIGYSNIYQLLPKR